MPGRIEKPYPLKLPAQAHANNLVIPHKSGTGRHLPASTLINGGNSLPKRTTLPKQAINSTNSPTRIPISQ